MSQETINTLIYVGTAVSVTIIGVFFSLRGYKNKNDTQLTGGIAAIIIAALILIWKDPNVGTALLAVATVVLAAFTGLLVNENRKIREQSITQDKKDRKERLLNETIQWLKNVDENLFTNTDYRKNEVFKEIHLIRQSGIPIDTIKKISNKEYSAITLININAVISEGEYIYSIGSKLNEGLGTEIEHILNVLKERKQMTVEQFKAPKSEPDSKVDSIIDEFLQNDKPLEGVSLSEYSIYIIKMGRNAKLVNSSILKALNKAIELKIDLFSDKS